MDSQAPTSTTNIHTIVKAQIVFLLSTLTEENFDRNQVEIRSLSEQHGIDTYLHFIRRLIGHSQLRSNPSASQQSFDNASTALTFRLLVQETQRLARDPFLTDRFREGIDKGEGDIFRHFDLVRFIDRVGLRPLERLVLASSIVAGAARKELVQQAATIIRQEFESAALQLCRNHFEHADLTPLQMQKLFTNLMTENATQTPVLDGSQRQALIAAAQTKYGTEAVVPMLLRILPSLSLPPGTSLVEVLVELGADVTSDPEVIRALFVRFGISDSNPPKDRFVIETLLTLGKLAAEGTPICDVSALVRAFSSFQVNFDWPAVIKSFDLPDRLGVDTATLKLLIAILLNSPRDADPHAVTGFWSIWNNPLYQLRLLDALLSLPPDTFNFVQLPGRRIVTVDDVAIASPTIKSLAANVQGHTWNSLELFEVLVQLANSDSLEIQNCVKEMLDKAIKISAELVHMGLLQVPEPGWNDIRLEYSRKLLAMFLAGHPNHQLVFMRIWQIEPTYLTNAFRDFYQEDPLNITRILDVAQDLKILEALLEVRPFAFALDVAALASRREYLNLDKWLADNVASNGLEFIRAVIVFLDDKMASEKSIRMIDPSAESRTMSLSPGTITIFLRMLRNHIKQLNPQDIQFFTEVRNTCLQIYPRLMPLSPGAETEPGLTVVTYSPDVEAEVDGIYKRMYDENIAIDNVVSMLREFKNSTDSHKQDVFSCMLHFLFDEYKFFQSYYPSRELAMTAYLFGSLIQHSLVEHVPLGIALRYILDALRCAPESNLFKFGLQALSRFEFRLPEWKPLCEALLTIPALADSRGDLVASIQRHLSSVGTPDDLRNVNDLTISTSDVGPVFTAIKPDVLSEPIEPPTEELSDKILFIINNLAPSNFDAKLNEMQDLFTDQHSRWLANYLVDQRIASEPNNHPLYLRFLDTLGRKLLDKFILHETFVKSAVLLNSEKALQAGAERNMLKHIGSWLGTITLARDKPIRHKTLAFKELLLEGFDTGRLAVAIPFVCKVLEGCSQSRVFKPSNPWLAAIISLLAELYFFGELKLNFKFEIEVLCSTLNIDLNAVETTTLMRNRPSADTLPLPEYPPDIDSLPIGDYNSSVHLGAGESQIMSLGPSSSQDRALGSHFEGILTLLTHHVQIDARFSPYHVNHTFKRAVQLAIDKAVRDIILPVVDRSVTIAGISTKELVTKDFATEANDDRLRKAAHLMAQRLAGSLALVTCKEPLKTSLAVHIRSFLTEHGFSEVAQQDQAVQLLVQENVDAACTAIEKAAMEKAVIETDQLFMGSYEARRRHRDLRNGQAFWDPSAPTSSFAVQLPDPLRIKSAGLQPKQLAVYDDFAINDHNKRRSASSRPPSAISMPQVAYAPSPGPENLIANRPYLTHQDVMAQFNTAIGDLESMVARLPIQSLAALPPNHDVRQLIRHVLYLATQAIEQRTPLLISQKIVQQLYKTPSQLGREVFVTLLDQLCRNFEDVAREAITWLVYAEDERKWNIPVTVALFRGNLITIPVQDQQLAKLLYQDPRPNLQSYTAGLIRECLSGEPPIATRDQFEFSLDILAQLASAGKTIEEVNRLLDDLQGVKRSVDVLGNGTTTRPESELVREKLLAYFQQWVVIFQRSHTPEKNFVPFITQLTKQGILKAEDMSTLFFRLATESSVAHYLKRIAEGEYEYAYQTLDALSRLIVYIIKYHGDASGVNNDLAKCHYFKKIISIFVLVLANLHEEQGNSFQQKPFFRFFSSLINDFHGMEPYLGTAYFQLLICLSDAFSSLQPVYFPGFAFSWMCLISHRHFMPKLLLSETRDGPSAFHKLLLALFKFLSPFLSTADLRAGARDLYRGALRLLLVLLHDFPEFLSDHYFSLCDVIPPRCIQLRNIVLSAFPRSLSLPDPHLPDGSFDNLPEMTHVPPILSDFPSALSNNNLREHLDLLLQGRAPSSFLPSLRDRLKTKATLDMSQDYNLSLINSMVMYIGISTISQAKTRSGPLFDASDPGVVALQYLSATLDIEGQHHLLSAMTLHLRFPNAHTKWYSSLMLHLFREVNDDRFREVMTKVLLERFIAHRPHPWGALMTFIELLGNPKYDFWGKSFIHIAPEITLFLERVRTGIHTLSQ